MADVYFTTNPSDFAKLEGLYVVERNPTGFISGRESQTIGLAGKCVRGPLTPYTITSPGEFLNVFGARDFGSGGALIGQAWAAMLNKPFGKLVIRRVAAADAVKASFTFEAAAGGAGTPLLTITASSVGIWGNDVMCKITDATNADANYFNLTAKWLGKEVLYQNLCIAGAVDNLAAVLGADVARYIDLAKVANGRPVNTAAGVDGADANAFVNLGETVALFTSVAGTEGTLAVTDYNLAMNDLAAEPGVNVCLVPEAVTGSAATYHSNLVTLAAGVADRIFLTWAQAHGQTVAAEITQVAAQITTRSDRIVWCYNSAYTYDPQTAAEIQTAPHVWLAGILSQIDVDIHAGSHATLKYLAGISRLTNNALTTQNLRDLKAAGISTLERNTDGPQFRSCVVTLLTAGRTELSRRRQVDFLQLSATDRLRYYVKGKNTPEERVGMASELTAFSAELRDTPRIVEDFEIDSASVNTSTQRAQGEEHILWRVRLIGDMLALVFETDIGTGTVIERVAA